MSFVYPGFLFGLFALSIPVIIHLFHFRRFRKVYFSNTSFLRNIKQEKQTRSKIKHLIILLLRMLAITSLVLSFAQPYIRNEDIELTSGKSSVSIYIDNSLSMENIGQDRILLEDAKEIAKSIIESYGQSTEFQIITNDFLSRHNRFYNKEEITELIYEIGSTATFRNLPAVFERQKALLNKSPNSNKISYLISDFQESTSMIYKLIPDTSIHTFLIPVNSSNNDNLSIDSVWFESPIIQYNQIAKLKAKIINASDNSINESTINLIINNKQKGIANFSIEKRQSKIIEIPFTVNQTGWNRAYLQVEDFPITFDDKLFFRYYVADKVNVLCINGNSENHYLRALFYTDEYFNYTENEIGSIDHSIFSKFQLLILNEIPKLSTGLISDLTDYLSNGGNLIIIPSSDPEISLDSYASLLNKLNTNQFVKPVDEKMEISNLNYEHAIFANIFEDIPENMNFPIVKKYYPKMRSMISVERKLLSLENGDDILTLLPYNKGNLFLFSVPLVSEWTNLPKHAIFVPIIYEIALHLKNTLPLSYCFGKDHTAELSSSFIEPNTAFEFKTGEKSFIPDYQVVKGNLNFYLNEEFSSAGFYDIICEGNNKDESLIPTLAFNYNRIESDLTQYSREELEKLSQETGIHLIKGKVKNISKAIEIINTGKLLWKLFLWLALGFLLAEILIIRFWKS